MKKLKAISLYLKVEEYEQVKKKANDLNMTLSAFLREALQEKTNLDLPPLKRGALFENENRRRGWNKRHLAIGAVIDEINRRGINPKNVSPEDALKVLQELAHREPNSVAGKWLRTTNPLGINSFIKWWESIPNRKYDLVIRKKNPTFPLERNLSQ